jgi:nuclear transcription factor Y gamma
MNQEAPSQPGNHTGNMQPGSTQQLQQQQMLQAFWSNQLQAGSLTISSNFLVEQTEPDFKTHTLPIARIKKVMKSDIDVKPLMISAEAPIIFARACEIFIEELTLRSWMHAEENKRRTVQRSDIATAVGKNDMYDFLIDIIPRDGGGEKAKDMPAKAGKEKNVGAVEELYEHQYAYNYPSEIDQHYTYQPEQYTMQQVEQQYQGAYQQEAFQQEAFQKEAFQQEAFQKEAFQQETLQQEMLQQEAFQQEAYQVQEEESQRQ